MLMTCLLPVRQRYGEAKKATMYRLRYRSRRVSIAHSVSLDNVEFDSFVNVAHHAQIANSTIGKRTSIGRYTKIRNAEIGNYCSISWDVTIGATSHPMSHASTHSFWYRKKFGLCDQDLKFDSSVTHIGHDVWIGCNVVIMPGVHIGNGAVIGAGSVVTKDVPSYAIYAGNPAKQLRYRFEENERKQLESLAWWYWDDDKMKENLSMFKMPLKDSGMIFYE